MSETKANPGGSYFADLALAGQTDGQVKRLPGFDKKRHTAPRFASDRAQAFLSRLCADELKEWAEELFAALRSAMGYRRKDISLDIGEGVATLRAKDFELERRYSLLEDEPDTYVVDTELRLLGAAALLEIEGFNQAVGPLFDRVRTRFKRAADVEGIVDALEDSGTFPAEYPSDCSYCETRLPGLDATLRFDAFGLEVRFSVFCAPRQLAAAMVLAGGVFVAEPDLAAALGSAF